MRAAAFGGLLVLAVVELWKRRDQEQTRALWSVARKHPTLYRVNVNDQRPILEVTGDGLVTMVGCSFQSSNVGVKMGRP